MTRSRKPAATRAAKAALTQRHPFIFTSINGERAIAAEAALLKFCHRTGLDLSEEGTTAFRDLLCNLGHYADWSGLDFEVELRAAVAMWRDERADPFENGSGRARYDD